MKRWRMVMILASLPILAASCMKQPAATIYEPAWDPGPASNEHTPIIRTSDPTVVTNSIHSKGVELGVDANGGGYINSVVETQGGPNIVSNRFGRGWQGSIRDQLHSSRYNPTQAGFSDTAGAPVKVIVQNNELTIPKFNMPLFSDPVYDFTQNEDLAPDYKGYKDNNNSDRDGLPETGYTQDDEVRSEFDYAGTIDDISSQTFHNIPGFRQKYYYAYARSPKAILQFNPNSVMEDGTKVINENSRIQDISKLLPGDQTPTNTDLSTVLFPTLGIRLKTSVVDYKYPMWRNGNQWHVESRGIANQRVNFWDGSLTQLYPTISGGYSLNAEPKNSDLPFVVIANGTNPSTAKAIGLYFPSHGVNAKPVVGIDKRTGKVVYQDDRRMKFQLSFTNNEAADQIVLRPVEYFSGILSPDHTQPSVMEAIYHEAIVLFGTPEEIYQTVAQMERKDE